MLRCPAVSHLHGTQRYGAFSFVLSGANICTWENALAPHTNRSAICLEKGTPFYTETDTQGRILFCQFSIPEPHLTDVKSMFVCLLLVWLHQIIPDSEVETDMWTGGSNFASLNMLCSYQRQNSENLFTWNLDFHRRCCFMPMWILMSKHTEYRLWIL